MPHAIDPVEARGPGRQLYQLAGMALLEYAGLVVFLAVAVVALRLGTLGGGLACPLLCDLVSTRLVLLGWCLLVFLGRYRVLLPEARLIGVSIIGC